MQNSKLQLKIKNSLKTIRYTLYAIRSQKGFTLVELLIVLLLLAIIGSIVGSILFSALKGANKTASLQAVRQNGNYAISQMAKTMRNAKNFNGVKGAITDNYNIDCTQPGTTQYKYVSVTDFNDSPVVFSCASTSPTINGSSLIDTSTVSMSDCYFTCSQNTIVDSPTIGINIVLNSISQSAVFSDQNSTLSFQTSVAIRNSTR